MPPAAADHLPYHDPALPVATRVADLLSRMSLDDKLGQMTQAERGRSALVTSPPTGSVRCSPAADRLAGRPGLGAGYRQALRRRRHSWVLEFAFPAGQQVTHGWSATWSQSGAEVTAENAPWNGTLAPGASVDIGFNGSHGGSNPPPTTFHLNDQPCTTG